MARGTGVHFVRQPRGSGGAVRQVRRDPPRPSVARQVAESAAATGDQPGTRGAALHRLDLWRLYLVRDTR